MKKIASITVKRIPDYDADLSWIGTFDNEPRGPFAIEHDPENPRVLHWFNPQKGACETQEQAQKDYERMLAYERGDWCMYGMQAEAEIHTRPDDAHESAGWKIDKITSGGLWGLEIDAGSAYFQEVAKEQIEDLREVLREFGFTDEEFNSVKIEYVD